MILRKDIQLVAYLINKRIDFKPFNTTIEVDESKLDEKNLFLLGQYKIDREIMRPKKYKKRRMPAKTNKEIIIRKKKHEKRQIIEVLAGIGVEIISFKEYKKLYKLKKQIIKYEPKGPINKPTGFTENIQKETFERPPSEYSNPQWQQIYYKGTKKLL